jgi:hypothetical protein
MMPPEQKAEAEQEFRHALDALRKSMPSETSSLLGQVSFPTFDETPEKYSVDQRAAQLERAVDSLIRAMNERKDDGERSRNVKGLLIKWFRATHHFATLFLTVALAGSAVLHPF